MWCFGAAGFFSIIIGASQQPLLRVPLSILLYDIAICWCTRLCKIGYLWIAVNLFCEDWVGHVVLRGEMEQRTVGAVMCDGIRS